MNKQYKRKKSKSKRVISEGLKQRVFLYLDALHEKTDGNGLYPVGIRSDPLDGTFVFAAFNGITKKQSNELFKKWAKSRNYTTER